MNVVILMFTAVLSLLVLLVMSLLSETLEGLQEIGRDAVWTVSSAKSGCGVDQVFETDPNTFWQ